MSDPTQGGMETVHRIEVAPMHMTVDVNIKVDRALDDFFWGPGQGWAKNRIENTLIRLQ